MIVLDIAVFATADADWSNELDDYIWGANYQFASFDIKLNCYPKRPADPVALSLVGEVWDRSPDFGILAILAGDVRLAASVALPAGRGIPVIICNFHRHGDAAVTIMRGDKDANRGVDWLSYILINSQALNSQKETLAHELIHAADYSGDTDKMGDIFLHDSDPTSIMNNWVGPAGSRPIVYTRERHAAALRQAYFARSV